MHRDEVPTDVPLVRRLLSVQFPQWDDLPVVSVPSSGTDNALYRLGEDMVVRLPRIERTVGLVDKEFTWLPRLAPHLPLSIPEPLGQGIPGEGFPWPWCVYRWLPGENPIVGELADPGSLARSLAQFVAALHLIDPGDGPPSGAQNFHRGVPLAQRDTFTRAAIGQLHGVVDTVGVVQVWQDAVALDEWSGPGVWIHGDLAPGNLLMVEGRLSAVIDFGGLGVGDPACDLIVAWNLLPAEARGIFRSCLGLDDETWARGRGWALSIALIQLPYYRDSNPALAASSRHVIREVLSDHGG